MALDGVHIKRFIATKDLCRLAAFTAGAGLRKLIGGTRYNNDLYNLLHSVPRQYSRLKRGQESAGHG